MERRPPGMGTDHRHRSGSCSPWRPVPDSVCSRPAPPARRAPSPSVAAEASPSPSPTPSPSRPTPTPTPLPTPTPTPTADADAAEPGATDRPLRLGGRREAPRDRDHDRRSPRRPAAVRVQRRVRRLARAGRRRHPALHADLPGHRSRMRSGRCAARGSTTSRGRPSGRRCTATPAARPRRCRRCAIRATASSVYNADEFRWGNIYYHRSTDRFAPHNVYTTGKELRKLAKRLGAKDEVLQGGVALRSRRVACRPARRRPDLRLVRVEQHHAIATTARRTRTSAPSAASKKQIDRADGKQVAPKNVVVMLMSFGPLNDGSNKQRLEADVIGSGTAWIATNGHTIKGTWRKTGMTKPTRFFDADGKPVTLTVGQTFVQVMPKGSKVDRARSRRRCPVRARSGCQRRPGASPSPS